MAKRPKEPLLDLFGLRFGTMAYLAVRRSHRRYRERPMNPSLIETLADALSAPTKSDLQQATS